MDPVSWVTLTRHAAICGALASANARPGRAVCLQSHQARDRVGGGDAICTTYTHGVQKTGRRRKRWNPAYKQKSCRVWNNAGLGQSPKLPVQSITQSHLIAIPSCAKAYCQHVTNMIHSWNNTCMLWICKGLSLLHLLIGALVKSDKKCIKKQSTFMCSLGNIHDVGDIRGQLGKERDGDSLPYPAADVPHQLWILFKFGWGNKQTTKNKKRFTPLN